jgi:hypothetical protein
MTQTIKANSKTAPTANHIRFLLVISRLLSCGIASILSSRLCRYKEFSLSSPKITPLYSPAASRLHKNEG